MARSDDIRDVDRYYDFLFLWSQITNGFRAFASVEAYAIHRHLLDAETGEYSDRVVHRLIGEAIAGIDAVDALDAGCGYGGTCLDLHRAVGGRWFGITINKRQYQIASRNAQAMGLEASVSFALASYDWQLPQTFNLVLGIESLIHSSAPASTIANLTRHLRPGGRFIIVDDMLIESLSRRHLADIEAFKCMWRCPIMPTISEWTRYLETSGCAIEDLHDLSSLMWPHSESEIAEELAAIRRRRRWRDRLGLRMVADAQMGGLLLERLTNEGASRYAMIVARKR